MAQEEDFLGLADDDASWHVLCAGKRCGPYRLSDLVEAIRERLVEGDDLIWRPGWSDWRKVRFIAGRLSPSFADMFDSDRYALRLAEPRRLILVHKLELKLKDREHDILWLNQFLCRHYSFLVINCFLFLVMITLLAAFSTFVFGNSLYGVMTGFFQLTMLLIICVIFIERLRVFRTWSARCAVPFALAGLLVIVMNSHRLPEAFDVWQGKRWTLHLRTTKQIERVAQEHPSNRFVAGLLASLKAAQQSAAATRHLIDDFRGQSIAVNILFAATKDELDRQTRDLRAAEARATLAWSDYLQILDAERSGVEQAWKEIFAGDSLHLLPKVTEVCIKRQERLREQMDVAFKAIAELRSAEGNLVEFIALQSDRRRSLWSLGTPGVSADQSTDEQFKRLLGAVRAAETKVAGFQLDNRILSVEQNWLWTAIVSAV